MKLINGVFYDDDNNVVRPEIGNPVQIKLLAELQSRVEGFEGDGLELDVDCETKYSLSSSLKCVCGVNIHFERDDAEDEDDVQIFNGMKRSCHKCKRIYQLNVKNSILYAIILK